MNNKITVGTGDRNILDAISDFSHSEKDYWELFQGVKSESLNNIFASSAVGSLLKEFFRSIVGFFEKLLDIKIFVRPPESVRDVNPELWSILKKISELKEKGIINNFYSRQSVFNDEPKLTAFSLELRKDNSDRPAAVKGTGKSIDDEREALIKALGETVERISLRNFFPSNFLVSSFQEFGSKAVNPELFSGLSFAERVKIQESRVFQKNHPKIKLAFDEKTNFKWIKVRSLLNNKRIYIPLQLMTLNRLSYKGGEPFIRFPISTGAAAGRNISQAALNGILEIIERDAFMITWLNQLSPEIINPETLPPNLKNIFRIFCRYNLELNFAVLPTDFGVPVILGVVIDRSGMGPAVAVGTKADFNISEAIKSVAEDVLSMRSGMRKKVMKSGLPDLSHLNLNNRAFFWYPLEMAEKIDFLVKGEKKSLEYFEKRYSAALSAEKNAQKIIFLKERLKELKLDAYWIEITDKKLSFLNIPAVMAAIPKMQALYIDECFPYREGERLKTVPKKFGFEATNNFPSSPHPFA